MTKHRISLEQMERPSGGPRSRGLAARGGRSVESIQERGPQDQLVCPQQPEQRSFGRRIVLGRPRSTTLWVEVERS